MAKVNPDFVKDIKKFGADEFSACFNCGNCTATCSLTDKNNAFPRKLIRYTVLGLESEIKSSVDPWLCYYCGECSTSCPRQADPGNLMMSLRRYLISKYDWTGLAGVLYKNLTAYIIAFLIVIGGVVGLYAGGVLDKEQMMHYGHYFEMFAIVGVFALILLPNLIRMWYLIVWKNTKKFVLKTHIDNIKELFIHMFTQKRSLSCDSEENKNDEKLWWFEHFMLVIGYLGLLFTTVVLNWFGPNSLIEGGNSAGSLFVIIIGYVFSAIVFVVTFDFVKRRIQKKSEKTTKSHPSDWFFVIWLLLMGISAFAVRLLIDFNVLENNFWVYLFHLTILVQWALIIVPFGKWTHFLYRSFAMYFSSIINTPEKKKA